MGRHPYLLPERHIWCTAENPLNPRRIRQNHCRQADIRTSRRPHPSDAALLHAAAPPAPGPGLRSLSGMYRLETRPRNRYRPTVKIHEYQAKEVLRKFGVVTPRGHPCFSVDEAV